MSLDQRQEVLRKFRSDSRIKVILMSLKAGGQGINPGAASTAFLLDPWWNPAVEEQAINRCHRIGQTRPVVVKRFVVRGTVEDNMLVLQERKRAVAADAVESNTAEDWAKVAADRLGLDDLKQFFAR